MTIEDLDDVYSLEVESYQFPWTREILRDCILYNYDSYSVFFGNKLVGYIISKISLPETHILNITVDSSFRNNGIGRSLVNLIIDYARLRNSEDILLEVRERVTSRLNLCIKNYSSKRLVSERGTTNVLMGERTHSYLD